jgi:mannose-1-phosphate guanylyltransferase/mannose-6-phosphate isomerase
MKLVTPVILCGGVGTRLWPMSRTHNPKQFQPIDADNASFFQSTVQRHVGTLYDHPVVCVSNNHIATVSRQLKGIGANARIISEPFSRNTGAALLATSIILLKDDPDAIVLALPSDHSIIGNFDPAIVNSLAAVQEGLIVTFGIQPRHPEIGYGYIVDDGAYEGYPGVRVVGKFVEKPPIHVAQTLIDAGNAFWASGISMFRAATLVEEYRRYAPATLKAVRLAVNQAELFGAMTLLSPEHYRKAVNEPTEVTIFEKSARMALVPAEVQWNDVGAWAAFHAIGKKDESGNVGSGDVLFLDTNSSYVRGGDRLIAVVGLDNVVVVDTPDALLVTSRNNSQSVKKLVEKLTQDGRQEVVDHRWLLTDWGRIGTISEGNGYCIKQMVLSPEMTMLIEPLAGRRSLLTIAEGEGIMQMGDEQFVVSAGKSFEIGTQVRAAISNTGSGPLLALEVICAAEPIARTEPTAVEITFGDTGSKQYA